MMWCDRCGEAVEVEIVNDYILHTEVGYPNKEYYSTYYCSQCASEVDEEPEICDCGDYKKPGEEYCHNCLKTGLEALKMAREHIRNNVTGLIDEDELILYILEEI